MRIFVATSFSTQVDEQGRVHGEHRQTVEALLASIREAGNEVICAIEAQNWIMGNQLANDAVKEDIVDIDRSEVLVAMLTNEGSAGVNFEVGYAVKAGKKVIFILNPSNKLRWFNQGLVDAGLATVSDVVSVAQQLK